MDLLDPTTDELRERYLFEHLQNQRQQARISELEKTVAELNTKVQWYEEQIRLAAHRRFAPSSEQTPVGQQALVFNEAEAVADPDVPEPDIPETTAEPAPETATRRKKAKGHREAQLANLEIREVEYPLPEAERICQCCQNQMEFVKWEVTRKVEVEPAKAFLMLYKQGVYTCPTCHDDGMPAPIKTATMPKQAFPKSIASPSFMAYIIAQKFVMGAPLYRQEQYAYGLGVLVSRQTMANWMIRAAGVLIPVYNRMHELLVAREIVQADETDVQVLHEPGRAATTDSTMWMYRSGRDGPPIVLFDYQHSRAGQYAKEFLQGFGGYDPQTRTIVARKYLQADGHEGYHAVPTWILVDEDHDRKVPDVSLVGCWAHARRKFNDALAVIKKEERKPGIITAAEVGLKFCNDLFKIEAELKDAAPDARLAARKERSEPILNAFKKWLDEQAINALPKTCLGKAVAYCLQEWSKLIVFLTDGRLEIDNNAAERSIKPFVIGRKNWLFANTPRGATASATLYSIVETAKENHLRPSEYLTYLFRRLPNINIKDPKAIDELLPWSAAIPDHCRKH